MKRVRYPAKFKTEAVKQVTERGHEVVDVAKRLGMSDKSLYLWVRLAKDQPGTSGKKNATLKVEVSRLEVELKRANEERDILKKAATYFTKLSGPTIPTQPMNRRMPIALSRR
ncbi:MAG: transposase [Candidatus Saccharibacteria bacterium]|nr:transposase [Rhodoferax sp.]